MVAADYFPNKDGYICDGQVIGFCYADDVTMAAGSFVKPGTTQAGYVGVAVCDVAGDAIGMCLRAPAAIGDTVPVAFSGIVKTIASGTIVIGDLVLSSTTTVNTITRAYQEQANSNQYMFNAGTRRFLGTALQSNTALTADEILVMLGKWC